MSSYEINPRPTELGGGWRLRLLEDGEEVGGGVFPIEDENPQQGVDWWSRLGVLRPNRRNLSNWGYTSSWRQMQSGVPRPTPRNL
ncbi:hypothetical protein AAKU58_004185 [Oxalobacteraceae bacterium GrIS 1.18]